MLSALGMARSLGVKRHHVVQTIWWGMLYGGETMIASLPDLAGEIDEIWSGR